MMDDSTIYESNVPALVPETVPALVRITCNSDRHMCPYTLYLTEYIRIYVNSNILYASLFIFRQV